jgi:hypothetical protein
VERISAEIGYWLGENYWNKGIMTTAVKEMTEYAFLNFPELHKLYAPVFDFNLASQRVLQKAGFEREAVLKQAAVKNGNVVDLHYYSIFKPKGFVETEGEEAAMAAKQILIERVRTLGIPELAELKALNELPGDYVNLECLLPNGDCMKILDDTQTYYCTQVESPASDKCLGVAAGHGQIAVYRYGEGGNDAELVAWVRVKEVKMDKE